MDLKGDTDGGTTAGGAAGAGWGGPTEGGGGIEGGGGFGFTLRLAFSTLPGVLALATGDSGTLRLAGGAGRLLSKSSLSERMSTTFAMSGAESVSHNVELQHATGVI